MSNNLKKCFVALRPRKACERGLRRTSARRFTFIVQLPQDFQFPTTSDNHLSNNTASELDDERTSEPLNIASLQDASTDLDSIETALQTSERPSNASGNVFNSLGDERTAELLNTPSLEGPVVASTDLGNTESAMETQDIVSNSSGKVSNGLVSGIGDARAPPLLNTVQRPVDVSTDGGATDVPMEITSIKQEPLDITTCIKQEPVDSETLPTVSTKKEILDSAEPYPWPFPQEELLALLDMERQMAAEHSDAEDEPLTRTSG